MDRRARRQEAVKNAQAAARKPHGRLAMTAPPPLGLAQADTAGLATALLLLAYLVYALVKAERF